MNQELEQLLFHYIIQHYELTEKCKKEFFSLGYIGEIFHIVEPFVRQYKTPPTAIQVIQLINGTGGLSQELRDFLNPNTIQQFWNVAETIPSYDSAWLEETVRAFLSWQSMIHGVKNALAYIKTVQSDVNIDNYQNLIDNARYKLTEGTAIEFTDDGQCSDFCDPETHRTKQLKRWSTGYSFLDRTSKGGYWEGSLWVFLGAPKAGKSRLLQNLCAEAIKQGHNSMYASFELQEEIVTQRIGANLFNIAMDDYDQVAQDLNLMQQKIREFQNPMFGNKPGYLGIKSFPTSAYSVNDLENFLLKEEERLSIERGETFKFKNIYVDYINIMKNWRNPNSENTYMKIKQIAEDLRAMAMKNHWCVISVTQVKASFFNAGDLDMSSASESSALGATVDIMGGIITDVIMQAGHYLYMKHILSRVSPHINERKKFNIDESHMRLTETDEEIIHDDQISDLFQKNSQQVINNYKNQQSQGKMTIPTPMSNDVVVNPSAKTIIAPQIGITDINMTTGEGLFD